MPRSQDDEPTYGGRRFTEWLDDYANPIKDTDPRDIKVLQQFVPQRLQESQKAIKNIGTNGIATLLMLMQSTDEEKRDLAYAGFMVLNRDAAACSGQLVELSGHTNAAIRLLASKCLVFIIPTDKSTLVPVFIRLSNDPNPGNRVEGSNILQMLMFDPTK